ncbi:glycosyltransferase family 2 protein [Ferruginibacter albus]|uniref:glycosyltransferase family 2 protein n=1 Tax=Ferruginibacter albus TaxID=2875540 RepID=UPI001CC7D4A3|nr:glycosyltransferase [Ferruginibacter albus]UAY50674.1 glycosyltransferase [Ferruginibacter albus]
MKKISVILPVYNGIKYLALSVESVLTQSYIDFDFHIIDDCSKDGSWEYLSSLKDSRIKLYRNEVNKGLFYNLNFLLKKAETDLVKLWSQDDIMYSNCLYELLKFHGRYPGISFSYSDRDLIDGEGKVEERLIKDDTPEYISPWLHAKIMLYTGSIAGNISNVCLNKKLIDEQGIGYFNEDMRYSGDLDMWERLTRENYIGRVRIKLIQLRNHTGQLSRQSNMAIKQLKENIVIYSNLDRRLPSNLKSYRSLCYNWKRNVYYYSVAIHFLRHGSFKLAKEYFKETTKLASAFSLIYHWVISKFLRLLNIEIVKLNFNDHAKES